MHRYYVIKHPQNILVALKRVMVSVGSLESLWVLKVGDGCIVYNVEVSFPGMLWNKFTLLGINTL